MPIGVLIDAISVVFGGLAGCLFRNYLSAHFKEKMNWIFGLCALTMGIKSSILLVNLPAVVLSVILGTALGMFVHLETGIQTGSAKLLRPLTGGLDESRQDLLVTAMVLFCASGTGIYGALDAGMTGNHTILLAKAVLDFFCAMIFACQLGTVTALISIPQLLILMLLFFSAKGLVPLTTETMIADFKACGGIVLLATGLRIMQVRKFPIVDMLPAMVLVMPASYAWTQWLQPLIG